MKTKQEFLKSHINENFSRDKLQSDASFRLYERIKTPDSTFIFMDSSQEMHSLSSFIKVDDFLVNHNYSAPKIIAKDEEHGFLLLEDLGTNTYTTLLDGTHDEQLEYQLYKNAVDVLINLQKLKDSVTLEPYDNTLLINEVLLLVDYYLKTLGGFELSKELRDEYIHAWTNVLNTINHPKSCLVLRDYHVDNLIWLDDRKLIQRVGLLDFQDAVIGSYAYDLVSLLEDARRDIPKQLVSQMISYYLESMPILDRKKFLTDYIILGTQRSCKVVGIFARKAIRDNNNSYLKHLPRVWSYIRNNIDNPLLEPVKDWFNKVDLPVIRDRTAL